MFEDFVIRRHDAEPLGNRMPADRRTNLQSSSLSDVWPSENKGITFLPNTGKRLQIVTVLCLKKERRARDDINVRGYDKCILACDAVSSGKNTLTCSHRYKNLKSKMYIVFYFHIFLYHFPLATSFAHSLLFYLFPSLLLCFILFLSLFNFFQFLFFLGYSCLSFSVFNTHVLCYGTILYQTLIVTFSVVNNNLSKG